LRAAENCHRIAREQESVCGEIPHGAGRKIAQADPCSERCQEKLAVLREQEYERDRNEEIPLHFMNKTILLPSEY